MATNFPTSLDSYTTLVDNTDSIVAAHPNDRGDAIEALEAKVGIDSSAVATSHDYKFTHLPAQAQNWDAGAYDVRGQTLTADVTTGTAPLNITSTTVCTNLNADTVDGTHLAGLQTILTNSAGLAAAVNDETGTGVVVFNTSPTLVTPTLGVATATSINGLTIDTTTGTLDITNAKTLTVTGNATISATPYTPGGTDVAIADGGTGASTAGAAINALLPSQTGNASKCLTTDASNPSWQVLGVAGGGTGVTSSTVVIQTQNTNTGAVNTGTTTIPYDDTIPQNTEGDEYMTLAITPKSATNNLKIEVVFVGTNSTNVIMTVGLFQDSTANALAATFQFATASYPETIKFTHYMAAGTTSATTFKVRAGGNVAGTTTFNGSSGARKLGGKLVSSITIQEIAV